MKYRLYEILGLNKDASQQDIKKAYKKMAFENHPDKNKGDPSAENKFKEISNAYGVLSDENEKRKYDQLGDDNYNSGGNGNGNVNPHDIFEKFFGGHGHPFANHFEQHFSFGGLNGAFHSFGEHHNTDVKKCKSFGQIFEMTLEDVNEGINKNLKLSIKKHCSKCISKCENCQGRGIINQVKHMGIFTQMFTGPCGNCQGLGSSISANKNCVECNGEGSYDKEQNAFLNIPPGVDNGFKTVFPELGEQPKLPNQTPGDLILEIKILDHKTFIRKGNDLHYKCDIDFIDSVIGKTIQIPHFKEIISINTNEFGVLSNEKQYMIEGKGLPLMNSNTKKGNLFIEFKINYPIIKNKNKLNELEELLKYTFV